MKRVTSPGSMQDTGCLGLVHWDDSEGWYGEGGGRRVQDGEHMYTYLWRIHFDIWQNQYNIVKFKNKIKNEENKQTNKNEVMPFAAMWIDLGITISEANQTETGNHHIISLISGI